MNTANLYTISATLYSVQVRTSRSYSRTKFVHACESHCMQGSGCNWCKLWSYTLSASIFKEFCKGCADVPRLFSEVGCYQEKPESKSSPQTEISNIENQALEGAGSKYTHNLLIPCHWLLTSSTVKCTSACTETLCKATIIQSFLAVHQSNSTQQVLIPGC